MDKRKATKYYSIAVAQMQALQETLLQLSKEVGLEGDVSTPPKNSKKANLIAAALSNRNKTIQKAQKKKASQGANS